MEIIYHKNLKRLPPEYYRGPAYVHWTMTIQERKTSWLSPVFYYKFREILTHTLFRYAICCPAYCCMPDHFHLIWLGLSNGSDQRNAMKFFRKQLNLVLEKLTVKMQRQAYDHVLREKERKIDEFIKIVDYIMKNPERTKLVKQDDSAKYPYSDCLVPGYPELHLFSDDFWQRFWRIYEYLQINGLIRSSN